MAHDSGCSVASESTPDEVAVAWEGYSISKLTTDGAADDRIIANLKSIAELLQSAVLSVDLVAGVVDFVT